MSFFILTINAVWKLSDLPRRSPSDYRVGNQNSSGTPRRLCGRPSNLASSLPKRTSAAPQSWPRTRMREFVSWHKATKPSFKPPTTDKPCRLRRRGRAGAASPAHPHGHFQRRSGRSPALPYPPWKWFQFSTGRVRNPKADPGNLPLKAPTSACSCRRPPRFSCGDSEHSPPAP
jgi:hypothetical protein